MKKIVLVTLSIVFTLVGGVMNMPTLIDTSLSQINFIISIFVLIFWGAFIFLNNKSKKMMIYTTIFWSMTFLTTLLAILSSTGQITLGILYLPVFVFLSPIFGVRYLIINPTGNLFALAVISLVFIIMSTYTLKQRKSTQIKSIL